VQLVGHLYIHTFARKNESKNNIFDEDLSTFILPSRRLQLEIRFRDKQQRK